jgi:hypothetical protein
MATATHAATRYLQDFFAEKEIDRDATFEIEGLDGRTHGFEYGVVIDAIMTTSVEEQKAIGDVLRRIDFVNGDVCDYLCHLAKALTR